MTKIPKRFQIGPHTITVNLRSPAEMAKLNESGDGPLWGQWRQGENAIYLRKVGDGFNASQQMHTFWHEYFHALFTLLNEGELTNNEKLVDQCGLLTMQMMQTAKF